MSELVRDSWGSEYSVYLRSTLSMSVLAYWKSLFELEKIREKFGRSFLPVKNNERDLAVAEDGKLVCLFHQAEFALCEGNLKWVKKG